MEWHQLNHMQNISTLLQINNHTSTSSLKFFMGQMLFLPSNQQCQNTEELRYGIVVEFCIEKHGRSN